MQEPQNNSLFSIIRITKWLIPVAVLAYLGIANFTPSGTMRFSHTVDDPSPFVSSFASKEPVTMTGTFGGSDESFQAITASPLYFNVTTPRLFNSVKVGLQYQNPDAQEVIKLGVFQPNGAYAYTDLAYYEPRLESLPPYWIPVREGNNVLWYRDREYQSQYASILRDFELQKQSIEKSFGPVDALDESTRAEYDAQIQQLTKNRDAQLTPLEESVTPRFTIDSFLRNLPDLQTIIKYNFDLSLYHELPGYEPKQSYTVINTVLRGQHDLYTYIGQGEPLYFEFAVRIASRSTDPSPITLQLYSSAETFIDEVELDTNIATTESNDGGQPEYRFRISQDDLPFGLYHVKFDPGENDVFIKQILSKQHLIVFRNHIYLADNPVYASIIGTHPTRPSGVYFKSEKVEFMTEHEEGLQTFTLNGVPQPLVDLNTPYVMSRLSGTPYAYIPKNDMTIDGNGYFAVSQDQFFDPQYSGVVDLPEVENIDTYDYIIARYAQVERRGKWMYATATIEIPMLYTNAETKKTEFIIVMPGLPEARKKLLVHGLTFEFHKDPLTLDNVMQKIRNNLGSSSQ
ncbi:MAG: hypothetical protein HZC01_05395 [Candidatus Kerfeldbacteria bacterium]|nr:hypothetical protein [Candidatus Kerfeldbacteria bacterium]